MMWLMFVNMICLQIKLCLIAHRAFSPPCWQTSHPTASMLSVISTGRVCCQQQWLTTMESNRDRHLELGHQGKMAVWVRIAGAMAWKARPQKEECVLMPPSHFTIAHYQNMRWIPEVHHVENAHYVFIKTLLELSEANWHLGLLMGG